MKVIAFALAFLGAIVLVLFLFKDYEIKNHPTELDGPIVAFGDSLVEGYGVGEAENFVYRLSQKIGEPIVNLGVSGNTTYDGVARLYEVLEEKPRIVLILLGGNDYLKRISKEETFSNLRTIVTEIQQTGAIVVLLGVRGGVLQDHYDTEYEALARETGSVYVEDVLQGIITKPDLMYDGIHPNDLGHQKIADKIYPKLLEVLE